MDRCGWCNGDVIGGGCTYGCDEECVCGSAVGDCHSDGPCPEAVESDRQIVAAIREYGRQMVEEAAVLAAMTTSAAGG